MINSASPIRDCITYLASEKMIYVYITQAYFLIFIAITMLYIVTVLVHTNSQQLIIKYNIDSRLCYYTIPKFSTLN